MGPRRAGGARARRAHASPPRRNGQRTRAPVTPIPLTGCNCTRGVPSHGNYTGHRPTPRAVTNHRSNRYSLFRTLGRYGRSIEVHFSRHASRGAVWGASSSSAIFKSQVQPLVSFSFGSTRIRLSIGPLACRGARCARTRSRPGAHCCPARTGARHSSRLARSSAR